MIKNSHVNYVDITSQFSGYPNILAICLVGSMTRSYTTQQGDVDLLMISDNLSQDLVLNNLSSYYPSKKINISDDAIRILGTTPVSIVNIDKKVFENRLAKLCIGSDIAAVYKPWAVLGNAPEVLIADVVDSIVLFERGGYYSDLKLGFRYYPRKLRSSILRYTSNELENILMLANKAFLAGDNVISNYAVNHSLFPLVRGMFAYERQFFRGMKYLLPQLKLHLPDRVKLIRDIFISPQKSLQSKIIAVSKIVSGLRKKEYR